MIDLNDPLPKFIPKWTKLVRRVFMYSPITEDPLEIASLTEDTIIEGQRLNWFDIDRCFVGEALGFNRKLCKKYDTFDHDDLLYGHSNFKTLNDFYEYKKKLFESIEAFKTNVRR